MYQVLLFKSRCHLCKGSIVSWKLASKHSTRSGAVAEQREGRVFGRSVGSLIDM